MEVSLCACGEKVGDDDRRVYVDHIIKASDESSLGPFWFIPGMEEGLCTTAQILHHELAVD